MLLVPVDLLVHGPVSQVVLLRLLPMARQEVRRLQAFLRGAAVAVLSRSRLALHAQAAMVAQPTLPEELPVVVELSMAAMASTAHQIRC